jgi:hypothetical protein
VKTLATATDINNKETEYVLALATFATRQEIETILSVPRSTRWPRQEQWWVSLVSDAGVITINSANANTALIWEHLNYNKTSFLK